MPFLTEKGILIFLPCPAPAGLFVHNFCLHFRHPSLDASLESENGIGPAAFPAFASPGVVPAFSASSCCPALRLTLAPRAVFPRVLPGHSPGLCLSPSLPSRAFPLPKACGLPSSVLVGNVHWGRLVVLWAVARVPGLPRCS